MTLEAKAEGAQSTTTENDNAAATPAANENDTTKATAPDKSGAEADGEKTTGESAEPPKTALEAAQRVMAKEGKQPSDAKPQQQSESQQKPAADAKGEKKPEADDDDSQLPFREHPRWKKMSSEHRMLKVAREKNEEAIKTLEPKAKTHDELLSFISANNLQKDDFQTGLQVMAALRNDPAKAYEMLKPVMEQLESKVGVTLPDDLKAKVEAGTVDANTAADLARARATAALAQERTRSLEERTAADEQARQEREEKDQTQSIITSLNEWEANWLKRDPDAAKLVSFVREAFIVEGTAHPPRNPEEAKKLAEACVAKVRERLQSVMPTPRAKDGNLPAGGNHVEATPVPKTALEAAQAALAATR